MWVVGSLAYGGFGPDSDIDIVVAIDGRISAEEAELLGSSVSQTVLPCPAAGLELVASRLIGLLAFGVHLMLLGVLVIKSLWTPKALGYVLIVAGLAYVADTIAHTLLGNYADYEAVFLAIVAVPSVVAEAWFGLWLLFKGGKSEASTQGLGAKRGIASSRVIRRSSVTHP